MHRRSNLLVLVGLLAFVLGLVAVYLVTRDDDDERVAVGPDSVEVVVATDDLTAGMSGDDLIAEGLVEVRRVARTSVQANAVLTRSQLSNTLLTTNVAEDDQIVLSALRPRSILAQQIELPAGMEAVAVAVSGVGGGAGYVTPGDRVNVYLVTQDCPSADPPRSAELLLTNAQVLDVSQTAAPLRGAQVTAADTTATANRTGVEGLTLLLALTTSDVEKVVFGSSVNCYALYVSLVDEAAGPAGPTGGVNPETILAEEAPDAFARSNPAGT